MKLYHFFYYIAAILTTLFKGGKRLPEHYFIRTLVRYEQKTVLGEF